VASGARQLAGLGAAFLRCMTGVGRRSGGVTGRCGKMLCMPMVAAEGGRGGGWALRRSATAPHSAYVSIRRQEQIMLWARTCHRTTVLIFPKLHPRNYVNPQLRA
jgi:hypothetical protein